MGTEAADEIVSPLAHGDADRVCVVSAALVAECAVCGKVTSGGGAHVPFIAYGFRCAECCPCRVFVATEAELAAMASVRDGRTVHEPYVVQRVRIEVVRRVRVVNVKPVLTDEERAERRRLSPAVRASLEKAWAARRAKDAARRQVGPPL